MDTRKLTTRFQNPHTAVPDWVAFQRGISHEARTTALAIIVMSKGAEPTREHLAEQLGVDVRTIARHLDELRSHGIITIERVGKRNRYIFQDPEANTETSTQDMGDPGSPMSYEEVRQDVMHPGSPMSYEEVRQDVMHPGSPMSGVRHLRRLNTMKRLPRSKRVHGGGGGGVISSLEEDLTPPTTQPLQTAHARYMLRRGIFAAAEFDKPEYNSELWIAAVEGMFREGLSQQRIVTKLRLDPPQEADPYWRSLLEPAAPVAPPEPVSEPASFEAPASELGALDNTNLDRIWPAALGLLKMRMPRQVFAAHVAVAELASIENGTAQIIAPSAASKAVLEDQSTQIRDALSELLGTPVAVRIALAKARGQ